LILAPLIFTDFYWVINDSARKGDTVYGAHIGSYEDPFFLNIQDESVTLVDGDILSGTILVTPFPEGAYKGSNPDAEKMALGTLMTLEHASGNSLEHTASLLFRYLDDFKYRHSTT
jgi:hypothetical protein